MRVQRGPDSPWRVLCEAQAVARESSKKTRAELQTADTFVARSHDFPAGNILDAVNETCEVTLSNAPAGNHLYEAHYKVTIDPVIPGAGTYDHKVVVAIETDLTGGGSWVEYWTAEYVLTTKVGEPDRIVEWKSERLQARVPSLTSSSKLRLKVKAASGPGGWTFQVHGFNLATNGDLLSGVTYHTGPAFDFNENGGGAELADTTVSKLSHGSHTTFMTDLGGPPMQIDVAPFIVARTVWGGNDSDDIAIDRFTAHLHPKENAGNPKDVAWFRCQPFALLKPGEPVNTTEFRDLGLVPLADAVWVPAGDGTSAQDYVFSWRDSQITNPFTGLILWEQRRPRPKSVKPRFGTGSGSGAGKIEYDSSPTTFWCIWALTADFTPASNVGWAQDAGTSEVVSSTRKLRTVQIRYASSIAQWIVEGPTALAATARGVLRCKIECGSYANANLEYTAGGNQLDFGATPTETVEFVLSDSVPAGCQSIGEVRNDADSAWLPFKDGQTAAEVGVSQREEYKVRWRALTNSQGDASPVLFEIGVRDVKRVWLGDVSDRITAKWSIPDVAELVPAIPEARIRVLRTGDADDFNDRITKLFAEHYSSAMSFRLWVGDPTRTRDEWFHKDDFVLVDDYDPTEQHIDIVAHSPLVLTRAALPVYNVTTEKREALTLANKTPKQLWDEIVANQLGAEIPSRYRGEGFQDQSTILSKTITDSDGKTELDAVAHVAGAVVSTAAGKLRAFDMFTPGSIRAFFPAEKMRNCLLRPGLRQRVPEFFVLYDYRPEIPKYEGETRVINGTALANLKTRGLDAPKTLRDEVCQYIPTEPVAKGVGKRRTDTVGGGMLIGTFTSTELFPELGFGDLVAFETHQFVARDPTQTLLRQIKGQLWVIGRIIEYDIEGREFAVWVQSWTDMGGTSEIGQRLGFTLPDISSLALSVSATQQVTLTVGCSASQSVRVATSTTSYPSASTVEATSPQTLDADGNLVLDLGAIGTLATMYVSAIPYERANGTGESGALRQAQITAQPIPATIKVLFLTSGTSWTVPGDFNSSNNSIQAIGGGGGGCAGRINIRGGGGGGGGEYRKITNFSPGGATVAYVIGQGGVGGFSADGEAGADGTDTTFNVTSLVAKKGIGSTGLTGGAGGTGGTGAGGNNNGGAGGNGASGAGNQGGGGGGGAGGTTAVGTAGSNASGSSGGAGGAGGATSGGAGGSAPSGTGGAGTVFTANPGGNTAGAGGGGGGANSGGDAGDGGNYGGGGGGGGSTAGSFGSGGDGRQGLIVITYTTA